jgi:HAD superfamily hydrolase (TIGR01490 family)
LSLAIFDLDDTLTFKDTESLWQSFLVEKNILSKENFTEKTEYFKNTYMAGTLDFNEVVHFSLHNIHELSLEDQLALQDEFINSVLSKNIIPQAVELVSNHYEQGHTVLIISAGHEFLIKPAVKFFKIHDVICTELHKKSCGAYSSSIKGLPVFREQKLIKLKEWLQVSDKKFSCTYFYSDSFNDLPLLEYVDIPVAVNPCPRLKKHAQTKGWSIMELKEIYYQNENRF